MIRTPSPNWQLWRVFFLRALAEQVRRLETDFEREKIELAAMLELQVRIVEFTREHGCVTIGKVINLTAAKRNTLKQHRAIGSRLFAIPHSGSMFQEIGEYWLQLPAEIRTGRKKNVVYLHLSKTLIILATFGLVTGCKLAVMVPAGGEVASTSTTRDCNGGSGGKFCTYDIASEPLPFSESFTAIAKPGYQFVKWQGGGDFRCPGSTNPVCTVSLADDFIGAIILAAFETGYLMPVFKDVGFDTDGDGIYDRQDDDDDNDGILDVNDPCPLSVSCGEVSIEQLIVNECTTTGENVHQTFTATQTGNISAISFAVDSSFLDQLVTTVYAGSNATGTPLYSEFGVMDPGPPTALRTINVYSPIPVTAGQVYTIALFAGTGMSWSVCGSSLNQYPGGQASGGTMDANWDLGFSLLIEY